MTLKSNTNKNTEEVGATVNIAASNVSSNVMTAFCTWISECYPKKHDIGSIIASWEQVSEQLFRLKLSLVSLWTITNKRAFKIIYNRVINNKLFRRTDRKMYKTFVCIGKLYLKFLKSNPVLYKSHSITAVEPSKSPMYMSKPLSIIFPRID